MRICVISKYPPVEGGVASRNYWLAKALGERGHKVYVVTNARSAEERFRVVLEKKDKKMLSPRNVRVFYVDDPVSPSIIRSHYFTEKLLSAALEVVGKYDVDLVYVHYLVPYGLAGLLTKHIAGKPLVVRHAGSDIGRLYHSPAMRRAIAEILKGADLIIGGGNLRKILKENRINANVFPGLNIVPPAFNPRVKPALKIKAPVLTYIGKPSPLKRIGDFIGAARGLRGDFRLLFVCGSDIERYRAEIGGLRRKAIMMPFQPPWKMPSIIRSSTCLVCPETDERGFFPPNTHYPIIAAEGMACGICVLIGDKMADKWPRPGLLPGKNVMVADTSDREEFRRCLQGIIDDPQGAAAIGGEGHEYFKEFGGHYRIYLEKLEQIFGRLIKRQ